MAGDAGEVCVTKPLPPGRLSEETVLELRRASQSCLAAFCSRAGDGPFGAAEDIVQRVFLRLLSGNYAIEGNAAPYLYRAVRNEALNDRRSRSREAPLGDEELWFSAGERIRSSEISTLQEALAASPSAAAYEVVIKVMLERDDAGKKRRMRLACRSIRLRRGVISIWLVLAKRGAMGVKGTRRKDRKLMNDDEQNFEGYLREFQPVRLRALPLVARPSLGPRRAAAVVIAGGRDRRGLLGRNQPYLSRESGAAEARNAAAPRSFEVRES